MHPRPQFSRLVIAPFLAGLLAGWVSLASAAPPPAATLVAPSGVVSGSTLTFTWQAAEGATFYYLQVNDATASPRFTLWYPATMACPGGSATCSITLTTGWGAGPAIWWVQTWNPDGFGPWSAGLRFDVTFTPGAWGTHPVSERFQLVLGGVAVLDKVTGLVWERTPSTTGQSSWAGALLNCSAALIGNVRGWRLPMIEELSSLMDPSQRPALPASHPFGIAAMPDYWSATTYASDTSSAVGVRFATDALFIAPKATNTIPRWCVRGGQTTQSPQ